MPFGSIRSEMGDPSMVLIIEQPASFAPLWHRFVRTVFCSICSAI